MARCSLCGTARAGARCSPGPTLQDVHFACFERWDRAAEADEHQFGALAYTLELLAELEVIAAGPRKGPQRAAAPARRAHRRAA